MNSKKESNRTAARAFYHALPYLRVEYIATVAAHVALQFGHNFAHDGKNNCRPRSYPPPPMLQSSPSSSFIQLPSRYFPRSEAAKRFQTNLFDCPPPAPVKVDQGFGATSEGGGAGAAAASRMATALARRLDASDLRPVKFGRWHYTDGVTGRVWDLSEG